MAGSGALIDEACGIGGSSLTVGEGTGDGSGGGDRIYFARYLRRRENRKNLAREYMGVHYPDDSGMRRLIGLPEGRPVLLSNLWTEDERRTSAVYNEGWSRLGARNGLNVHFKDPDGLGVIARFVSRITLGSGEAIWTDQNCYARTPPRRRRPEGFQSPPEPKRCRQAFRRGSCGFRSGAQPQQRSPQSGRIATATHRKQGGERAGRSGKLDPSKGFLTVTRSLG